jgi:hypothetical protein
MAEIRIKYLPVSPICGLILERSADSVLKYDRKGRVLKLEELSERGRLVRERFEDCFRACLARRFCRNKLGLWGPNRNKPTEETKLRPNSRNLKKLRKFLRQDDCVANPYLKWSRAELLTALTQRHVSVHGLQSMSRFACRMALEEADKHRTFQLMDLPAEVRTMVYKYALLSKGPVVVKTPSRQLSYSSAIRCSRKQAQFSSRSTSSNSASNSTTTSSRINWDQRDLQAKNCAG